MNPKFQSIKGTKDLLPQETGRWQRIESLLRTACHQYGYDEIRTPLFEETALFARGIGSETDIVGKEMYTFRDKGDVSLTLRPEMTASVVRAYIQHHLGEQSALTKLYYVGPMFRQERPQAGRLRQFHQFGFEAIGQSNALVDVEVISLAADIYARLGVPFSLRLNSVGDEVCRPRYRSELRSFLHGIADSLTPESRRRIDANVLRVLDSKDTQDREITESAPRLTDHLCDECAAHFREVQEGLRKADVPFTIDHRLVRGLDYYTKTAFEFLSEDLGAQDALGGGGRYDGLIGDLGGKSTPAVGFAAGMERLFLVLEKRGVDFPQPDSDVYVVGLDPESRLWAFDLVVQLRKRGYRAEMDYAGRSIKAQLREANRIRAAFAVIVGSRELETQTAVVRSMRNAAQENVGFENVLLYLENQMKRMSNHVPAILGPTPA